MKADHRRRRAVRAYKLLQFVQAEEVLAELLLGGFSLRQCYAVLQQNGLILALSLRDFMRLCRDRRPGVLNCD